MKITSVKGNYEGNAADCLNWLEEMQPSIVSVEIGSVSQSLDVSLEWRQSVRNAVVEMSEDIDGGEDEWQQYLSIDAIAAVIAAQAAHTI